MPRFPASADLRRPASVLIRSLSGFAVALSLACNDERVGIEPPRPDPFPVAANAWLVVSDSTARAGADVSIAAFARAEAGGSVGSFTARFLYDTLQLRVTGPDSVADDVLRAMNPIPGAHRIAGASASGIPGGLLFRVRATVIDPRGLRRLGLVLDEMHAVTLADLTQRLTVSDTREALLRDMPGLFVRSDPKRRP